MEPQLLHSVADSVATVVIHHPEKRNAMTSAMWAALPPLLDELAADPDVRALVLTGAGGTFCAGADIGALQDAPEEAQGLALSLIHWRPCAGTAWAAVRSLRRPAICGSRRRARCSG